VNVQFLAVHTLPRHLGFSGSLQSASSLHSTQVDSLQTGVGATHSAFVRHCTQRPSFPQTLFTGFAAHSALVRHSTQRPAVALHLGVGAAHCVSALQPARQWKSSQIGAAVPQSAFERHATHFPVRA
jgi:hypothetical protein